MLADRCPLNEWSAFAAMKASIRRRTATIRLIVIAAKFVVLFAGLLVAGSARADVVVKGRKLPWTATIPGGWVGGTAEDIERILAKAGTNSAAKGGLDEILGQMLAESKRLDAFFLDLDVTGADKLSMLRVNLLQLDLEPFAEEAHRKSFWAEYAQALAKHVSDGSKVEVTRDRSTMTGGRKAYEATFVTTLPNGGKVYTVVHMVAYAAGHAHVFSLEADGRKFRARFADLERILGSLSYRGSFAALTSTMLSGSEDEVKKLAEGLRGNKEALMKLKPTAGQIVQIAANDEDAKALSAYVEQQFANIPATGINVKGGQSEILVTSGVMPADLYSLPGGYAQQAAHFKKGVAIFGFQYVAPGETSGMAFDGLVKLGKEWVMIPKAWRAFAK